MAIGEIIQAVCEVSKEISKEVVDKAQKLMKELDKPLNSEESDTGELNGTELDFEACEELDKPLNVEDSVGREAKDLENQDLKMGTVNECENIQKQGGRFGDIYQEGEGDFIEVHHTPADSVTELSRNDGPAIRMEKVDHRQTASCGNSKEAREYREEQKRLIDEGKFEEAVQMDVDDLKEKFGDKYEKGIKEMEDYVNQLKEEGKI